MTKETKDYADEVKTRLRDVYPNQYHGILTDETITLGRKAGLTACIFADMLVTDEIVTHNKVPATPKSLTVNNAGADLAFNIVRPGHVELLFVIGDFQLAKIDCPIGPEVPAAMRRLVDKAYMALTAN